MKYFFYITVLFLIVSCRSTVDPDKGIPLARVDDEILYDSDIKGLLPENISHRDSIIWVNNYVNNWVRNKLLINKAEENLDDRKLDFKNQLEKYKNSLIIYTYQNEIIKQNLDTTVSIEEVEKYYNEHLNDFVLLKNIVRVMYIVTENSKEIDKKFSELFTLPDSVMMDSLEANCEIYARDYFLDTTVWIPFDELLNHIPIKVYNKELYLKNNKFVKIKNKKELYFVKFIDFKIKNDHSPLELEEDNIKSIIINKRKVDLVKELRKKLFENALKKNEIEIYTYD